MSHVVIVENQLTRPFELLRTAVEMGHEVTFVTSELALYLRGRRAEDTDLRLVRVIEGPSTADPQALVALLEPLAAQHPIDALFTTNDAHLLAAAVAAERFGARHTRLAAVRCARDKFLCRERLAERGVAQPAFRFAPDADAAVRAAAELGYPVVVKPVDGSASINVGVAADAEAVRRYCAAIAAHGTYGRSSVARQEALIESYLPGPLVSCETMSSGGRHLVLGVTDRNLSPLPAQVELGGCFPAPLPEEPAIAALCCAALDAIGFDIGTAQTEIILHENGPHIVEINGRMAGGIMPFVLSAALERSVHRDTVELWLNGTLPALSPPRRFAAIQSVVTDRTGTIAAVEPSPYVSDPEVLNFDFLRAVGDPVRPPQNNRDRLGTVICVAPSAEQARSKAHQVAATTVVRVDEAPAGAGSA